MGKSKKRNLQHAKEYEHRRYWSKRKKGLCAHNGCNEKANGVYCSKHYEYHSTARKRSYIRKLKQLAKMLTNPTRSLCNVPSATPVCSSLSS